MSVGDPVDEVEHNEDRGGYPHGPGVDIVHQRLLPRSQSQLDVLKIFMSDIKNLTQIHAVVLYTNDKRKKHKRKLHLNIL